MDVIADNICSVFANNVPKKIIINYMNFLLSLLL